MDYTKNYLSPKHDYILGRDLTQAERLDRSRSQIGFMRRYLDQLENTTNRVSNTTSEENLLNYAKAIDTALKAIENAVFFGDSGYHPQILEMYGYED